MIEALKQPNWGRAAPLAALGAVGMTLSLMLGAPNAVARDCNGPLDNNNCINPATGNCRGGNCNIVQDNPQLYDTEPEPVTPYSLPALDTTGVCEEWRTVILVDGNGTEINRWQECASFASTTEPYQPDNGTDLPITNGDPWGPPSRENLKRNLSDAAHDGASLLDRLRGYFSR